MSSTRLKLDFLRLPLELRQQVYAICFEGGVSAYEYGKWPDEAASFADLILTCRQVHDEALPWLFRSVDLGYRPAAANEFLQSIGNTAVRQIKYFRVQWNCFGSIGDEFSTEEGWNQVFAILWNTWVNPREILVEFDCDFRIEGVPSNANFDTEDGCTCQSDRPLMHHLKRFGGCEKIILSGYYNPIGPSLLAEEWMLDMKMDRGDHTLVNADWRLQYTWLEDIHKALNKERELVEWQELNRHGDFSIEMTDEMYLEGRLAIVERRRQAIACESQSVLAMTPPPPRKKTQYNGAISIDASAFWLAFFSPS